MPPSGAVWSFVIVVAVTLVTAGAWVFRRLVVLFAALEAVERIDENAPTRATPETT